MYIMSVTKAGHKLGRKKTVETWYLRGYKPLDPSGLFEAREQFATLQLATSRPGGFQGEVIVNVTGTVQTIVTRWNVNSALWVDAIS